MNGNDNSNGYFFSKGKYGYSLSIYDMGDEIELISWDLNGNLITLDSLNLKKEHLDIDYFMARYPKVIKHIDEIANGQLWSSLSEVAYIGSGVSEELGRRLTWAYERKLRIKQGLYNFNNDLIPYFIEQNEMKEKVVKKDVFSNPLKLIGGVDVAYNEEQQKMIGAIVVLDRQNFEIIDKSYFEMEISFPYVPGLFSFREVPSIIEAYNRLKIKPDIIICDGQGIAHPKGIGMATHLGIKLNIPTIGCAKKKLIGIWEENKLNIERGSLTPLKWNNEIIGNVLRTQHNIKPLYISIGHKISLETATSLVLELCPEFRLPETTRRSDQMVNKLMKDRLSNEEE